jgi:hypothetical protein
MFAVPQIWMQGTIQWSYNVKNKYSIVFIYSDYCQNGNAITINIRTETCSNDQFALSVPSISPYTS